MLHQKSGHEHGTLVRLADSGNRYFRFGLKTMITGSLLFS